MKKAKYEVMVVNEWNEKVENTISITCKDKKTVERVINEFHYDGNHFYKTLKKGKLVKKLSKLHDISFSF